MLPKRLDFPGSDCWDGGKYPSDCHISWSAIILCVSGDTSPAAVNVGDSPGFAVFCMRKNLKGNEKNE